jgi:hypothetical protein
MTGKRKLIRASPVVSRSCHTVAGSAGTHPDVTQCLINQLDFLEFGHLWRAAAAARETGRDARAHDATKMNSSTFLQASGVSTTVTGI